MPPFWSTLRDFAYHFPIEFRFQIFTVDFLDCGEYVDAWHRRYQVKQRKYSRKTNFLGGTSRWLNWHKTKNIVKSKKVTYRFQEDMSWNVTGRFGRFLRMFGDMQTGLKTKFSMPKRPKFRDKSMRPARRELADRHPLSSSIHRDHSIRLRLCSYLPGDIDRSPAASGQSSLRDRPPARFRCSSREPADRSYLPRSGKRGDCLQIGEKNTEWPL